MIFEQLQRLYEAKLYEDVKLLSNLAVSFSQSNPDQFGFITRYQMFCYQADAYYHTGDYHAAINSYKNALQIKSLIKNRGKKNCLEVPVQSEVKFKQYKCYMKLHMYDEAFAVLDSIAPKQMTVQMNMAHAQLLHLLGRETKSAMATYKEILKAQPMSLTAIKGLIMCGMGTNEVIQFISPFFNVHNNPSFDWLLNWIQAQGMARDRDYKLAAHLLQTMDNTETNVDILAQSAEMSFLSGDYFKAMSVFRWIRELNPLYYRKLDTYAFLLHQEQTKHPALERLASKTNLFPESAVEPWIITGYYNISFNKAPKAIYFAQKALTIEPRNFEATMMYGVALMVSLEYQDALVKFREALHLCPHRYEPYHHVVEVYWKTNRKREAVACAVDYQRLVPSATSYTLHAVLLIKDGSPSSYEKARAILEKAVSLDAEHLEAVLLLARVYEKSNNYQAAINLLEQCPPKQPSLRYHKMMANLLLKLKNKMKALDHSIIAKKLEPLMAKGSLRKIGDTPLKFYLSSDEDTIDVEKSNLDDLSPDALDDNFMNGVNDNFNSFS